MPDPQHVETVLARLMPPALSEGGRREIETMLDDLAGTSPAASNPRRWHWLLASGLAAALAAMAGLSFWQRQEISNAVTRAVIGDAPPVKVLAESDRVETVSDEGWSESPDGAAMRAMRLRVVGENRVLDNETGIVMHISEPREEWLLMPVSAF
jgi:hypothetical protein